MAGPQPKLRELFSKAAECQTAEEQAAFLNEACRDDAELRAQLEDLLQAHREAGSFLQDPSATGLPSPLAGERGGHTVDAPPLREQPGLVIGPYKLLQQIGEGGMGTVFMAEQTQPVQRKVALKVIKAGMDSRQVIARFEAERQALALMDHVNIARVFDGGATENGRPYFVMELVHGVPITKYCDDNQLSPRERLELFVPVCQAIQHAHQKGIIHRDVKPTNVLVTLYDGRPVPKVIDFGVAKATEQKLTERTLFTQYGTMVGTLEYMSPEQAELSALGVDTRSDIYSLGVLLYELLTGSTPLTHQRMKEAAYAEILRMIREEEPPRPSTRLSDSGEALASISAQRKTEPAKLSKLMRGELDWIVMKTLEKDRNRRYETANGFALDVQRYLNDETVRACPPSALYRFRKFARRNRVAILTATLVSLALMLGTVVSTWQAIRATHAQGLAQESLVAETEAHNQASAAEKAADKARLNEAEQRGIAEANKKTAEANELLARRRFYAAQMNLAIQAFEADDLPQLLQLLETQRPRFDEGDLRGFEWYALWELCQPQLRYIRNGRPNTIQVVAFSPDSATLAVASSDGTVKIHDVASGKERATLRGAPSTFPTIAFSPDGQGLAQSASSAAEGTVTLWDVRTAHVENTLAGTGAIRSLAFSRDGQVLALGNQDGSVQLWNAIAGKSGQTWKGHPSAVSALAFSADGRTLVTADDIRKASVKFWDLSHTPPQMRGEIGSGAHSLSLSPDGKNLAVGSVFGLRVYDLATQKELPIQGLPSGRGRAVAYSPDGKSVAVGLDAHRVQLVDLTNGKQRTFAHLAPVLSVAIAPDGKTLASVSADARVKVWGLAQGAETGGISTKSQITAIAYSPDDKTVAVGCADKTVRLYDSATYRMQAAFQGHTRAIRALAYSPDGRILASGSGDWVMPYSGELKVWDVVREREIVADSENESAVYSLAFPPQGATLAVGSLGGTMMLWDVAAGRPRATFKTDHVLATVYTPDGAILVCAGSSGRAKYHDPTTGAERFSFRPGASTDLIWSMACSANGKLLATGDSTGSVRLWEFPSGRLRASLRGHTLPVNSVAFLADGKSLVSASDDWQVKFWDLTTGQERVSVKLGSRLAVAPGGQALAVAGNSTVRILRAAATHEALAGKDESSPDDPESPIAQTQAGDRLRADGQFPEAEQAYRAAAERLQKLTTRYPDQPLYRAYLAMAYFRLSLLLQGTKRAAEAEQAYVQGLQIQEKLGGVFPDQTDHRRELAHFQFKRADQLVDSGRLQKAEAAYRESIDGQGKLAADFPGNPGYRHELARYHNWLGRLLGRLGRLDEAEQEHLRARELYENLTHSIKQVADSGPRRELAWTYMNLGDVYRSGRRPQEAVAAYERSLALSEALAAEFPAVAMYPHWVAVNCGHLAHLHMTGGRSEEAQRLFEKLLRISPKNAAALNNLAWMLATSPHPQFRDAGRATELAKKAVELGPKEGTHWNTLGVAHYRADEWKVAVAALEKSCELRKGGDAFDWFFLAMARWQLGEKDEARQCYDRAVAWMENHSPNNEELGRFREEAARLLKVAAPSKSIPLSK